MKKTSSYLFALLLSSVLFFVFFGACKKRPELQKEEKARQSQMDELVQKGKSLYSENACHSCHGLEGAGDGLAGVNLNPPPRDYRELRSYTQGSSIKDITKTLFTGVTGTSMAPYPHLSETKRRAIAAYVVYLQKQ